MSITYDDAAAIVKSCSMQDFWNIHPEWYRLADKKGWLPLLYPGQPPLFPIPRVGEPNKEQEALRAARARLSVATEREVENFIKLPTERNYCYVLGYLTALEANGLLSNGDLLVLLRFMMTVKIITRA